MSKNGRFGVCTPKESLIDSFIRARNSPTSPRSIHYIPTESLNSISFPRPTKTDKPSLKTHFPNYHPQKQTIKLCLDYLLVIVWSAWLVLPSALLAYSSPKEIHRSRMVSTIHQPTFVFCPLRRGGDNQRIKESMFNSV